MNLDLYQLRTFFTVARTLNFTEAAKRLHVTQSAVSHALRKLERSAGEELLGKAGGKFSLTEPGRILYRACETIFYELEKAEELMAGSRDGGAGVIRLGATVEFGTTLLVKYLKGFINRNPGIHIDFQFKHELLRPLLNDELDIIIDCDDHKADGIEKRPLFREEYAVIASGEFIKKNGLKDPAALAACNILSLDKGGLWWGNFLNSLPRNGRPEFKKITEINHERGIINAAIESLGAGFVPKYCVLKELKAGTLKNVFPRLELLEDHFSLYQKTKRAGLERHRRLADYLANIKATHLLRP